MSGPLSGIRVVEVGGIGPVPQAALLLSGLGAEVLRIEAPSSEPVARPSSALHRGRPVAVVDLRTDAGREVLLELAGHADVVLEGNRPGVAERLGVGPVECSAGNPGLIYARMTGWGQSGPLATTAGHDINYIAVAGALGMLGRPGEPPAPPLNLIGDLGGGAMFAVAGILAALVERTASGHGQVVDIAMVDGVATFLAMFLDWHAQGGWSAERGTNLIDGGAPFYDTYRTADGRYLALGALEPAFYADLLSLLGLEETPDLPEQYDTSGWPRLRELFRRRIATRTRAEWVAAAQSYDACVSPVLGLDELAAHPHLAARGTYTPGPNGPLPAPAPRFGRTPTRLGGLVPEPRDLARAWGVCERSAGLLVPHVVGVQPNDEQPSDEGACHAR